MIAENLKKLRQSISEICRNVSRNPEEIKLIAVSKFFGAKEIMEAFRNGITDFGENKAQELEIKFDNIPEKINWHFIGTLQKNKVKTAVKCAGIIHSVDSLILAEEINKRANLLEKKQQVLLQMKTSCEDSKFGISSEDELIRIADFCMASSNINLLGLMTMAPLTDNEKIIRDSFSSLRNLMDKLNVQGFKLKELSMGMTSDYKIAIEEGSTMLRIGSAIFGERDYSKSWREL
jgi:hypothetical protein